MLSKGSSMLFSDLNVEQQSAAITSAILECQRISLLDYEELIDYLESYASFNDQGKLTQLVVF